MVEDSPSRKDTFVHCVEDVEGVVLQLGRSDGGQASTVKEVVQKRAFHLLLTAVWAVTDSSLNYFPRALVSQPDTVQYDSRLARHISRSIETVILCHYAVPGGGRGAMSYPGIVL